MCKEVSDASTGGVVVSSGNFSAGILVTYMFVAIDVNSITSSSFTLNTKKVRPSFFRAWPH
jgi:hypothetical protein